METSNKGLAFIASHEGIVPYPYKDSVGVWTFGIGHTAWAGPPNPNDLPRGKRQDLDYVFDIFRKDIKNYEAAVNEAIKVPVSQHQFDAAVSFHYNTGSIASAYWVRSLNNGNVSLAAEQIMNWQKPREIIPRRKAEQALFKTGDYGSPYAAIWTANSAGKIDWGDAIKVNVLDVLKDKPEPEPEPEIELEIKPYEVFELSKARITIYKTGATIIWEGIEDVS